MSTITQAAISLASVLLIGNLLIIAHELGHYGVARIAGVTANRFSIGFEPQLFRYTDRRRTEWTLACCLLAALSLSLESTT